MGRRKKPLTSLRLAMRLQRSVHVNSIQRLRCGCNVSLQTCWWFWNWIKGKPARNSNGRKWLRLNERIHWLMLHARILFFMLEATRSWKWDDYWTSSRKIATNFRIDSGKNEILTHNSNRKVIGIPLFRSMTLIIRYHHYEYDICSSHFHSRVCILHRVRNIPSIRRRKGADMTCSFLSIHYLELGIAQCPLVWSQSFFGIRNWCPLRSMHLRQNNLYRAKNREKDQTNT